MPYSHAIEQFLGTIPLWKSLPLATRREVVAASVERRFAGGETIFQEGQPSHSVWLLKAGRVHLVHHLVTGRVSTTCVIVPRELFCCLPALDRGVYPATAVAATDSVVVQIPSDRVHAMMAKDQAFAERLLCTVCDRLRQVEAKACHMYDPVDRRIARALLTLEKKFDGAIPLTRQEIAELVGTTVETAIRTISHFHQEGWVRSMRGKIQVVKPERLRLLTQQG